MGFPPTSLDLERRPLRRNQYVGSPSPWSITWRLFFPLTDSQTDPDVVVQFERARDELHSLIQNVGSFVNWWGDMHTSLWNLEEILPQVRVIGTSPFRIETVIERWIAVCEKYTWYQRHVGYIVCLSQCTDVYRCRSATTATTYRAIHTGKLVDQKWLFAENSQIFGSRMTSHTPRCGSSHKPRIESRDDQKRIESIDDSKLKV
jgi:hypothetical protein